MPHVGCNAYVRRSDGGTAPNLVRRYGRLCADGLRGWSARVARRAGVRVRAPVNGCLTSMAGDSIRVRAPGLPQRSCRPRHQQLRTPSSAASAQPCAAEGHGPAAPNAKVQPHAAPTQLCPTRRSLAPHVGCNATLGDERPQTTSFTATSASVPRRDPPHLNETRTGADAVRVRASTIFGGEVVGAVGPSAVHAPVTSVLLTRAARTVASAR
jgi:hypothetical protein